MAAGDMIIFDQAIVNIGEKLYDMNSDTFKFGLVDNTTTPTRDTADPHWGGTGTTNFATNEVGTGGGYTGVVTIVSPTWAESSDTFKWDFADPATIAQDASGATDIYWMIVYDDTDANKRAICAIDLGGPVSLVAGSLTITINASGIFTIS